MASLGGAGARHPRAGRAAIRESIKMTCGRDTTYTSRIGTTGCTEQHPSVVDQGLFVVMG
jgi:hypothetical protein